MRITLSCTEAAYDALWRAAHKRGRRIEVDRAALLALLQDHARVLANPRATIENEYPPGTLARAGGGEAA